MKPESTNQSRALSGVLLGTAVGDALGLPVEGLRPGRVRRFFRKGLRHRLIFGKGMFSDDTEHTLMVAMALLRHPADAKAFQKALARSLKWWLAALPAGVGLSTARAIAKLWLGFPATRSGVKSAGNGAAMRSAVVGVFFADDAAKRREFAQAACVVTHVDERAVESALLVAEAAALAARHAPNAEVLERLGGLIVSREMRERWPLAVQALAEKRSVEEFAQAMGCGAGVSGFAPNTVAAALFAWLRHRGDFEKTVSSVILLGGDTDTVAAIAGGICGAEVGEAGMPQAWLDDLADWPRSTAIIHQTARALTEAQAGTRDVPPPRWCWPGVPFRNAVFLLIVLGHGLRRLIPF